MKILKVSVLRKMTYQHNKYNLFKLKINNEYNLTSFGINIRRNLLKNTVRLKISYC